MKIFRNAIILLIFICTSTLSFSQDELNTTDNKGNKQGKWQKKYPNGKIAYEGSFVNNTPVGDWKRYHENGTAKAELQYQKDGTCIAKLFSEDGQLTAEGKYLNEKKIGKWKYYTPTGKLLSTENYTIGLLDGIAESFNDDGKVVEQTHWKNGKREGEQTRFNIEGVTLYKANYKNNKQEGLVQYFYPSGKIRIEGNYSEGRREGKWKTFDEEGRILDEIIYTNGLPEGYEQLLLDESEEINMYEQQKGKFEEPEADF